MEIHGQIKEADYVAAQFIHIRPRPLFAIAGILLLAIAFWAMLHGSSFIIGGCLTYFLVYFIVFIPYSAKKNYRLYKALSEPVTITVHEKGLYFKRESGEGVVTWPEIVKWRHGKDLLLLYPTNNIFYLLPRHIFSPEASFEEFISMISAKCGTAR